MTTTKGSIPKAFFGICFSQGTINSYIWRKFSFIFWYAGTFELLNPRIPKKSVFIPDFIQIIPRKFYSIPKKAFFIPRSRRKMLNRFSKTLHLVLWLEIYIFKLGKGLFSTINIYAGWLKNCWTLKHRFLDPFRRPFRKGPSLAKGFQKDFWRFPLRNKK